MQGVDDRIRRKPNPDATLRILELMGLSRDDAVYIGDTEVDIETAQNAGIPCISVDWGFRNRDFLEQSEKIVQNLKNGIEKGNKKIISENIMENGKQLRKLNGKIYSRKLLKLIECAEGLDICAKSSGAGGGDCGIAISFNENDTEELLKRWKNEDIELLYKSEF